MSTLLLLAVGYVTGAITAWLVFRPAKAFDEGFKSADKYFSDWEKAYDRGFDDGIETVSKIATAWKERKSE